MPSAERLSSKFHICSRSFASASNIEEKYTRVPLSERRRSPVTIGKLLSRQSRLGSINTRHKIFEKSPLCRILRLTSISCFGLPLVSRISSIFYGSRLILRLSRSTTNSRVLLIVLDWHFLAPDGGD